MTKEREVVDVFLSAAHQDERLAEDVRRTFEDRGLTVFATPGTATDDRLEERIRSAIAEARVFVAILSRASMTSEWVQFELGAAWVWDKPVVLLLHGIDPEEVPRWLIARSRVAHASELPRMIDEIERSIEPLSEDQERRLGELYGSIGVATESLADRPEALEALTSRFSEFEESKYSSERIF